MRVRGGRRLAGSVVGVFAGCVMAASAMGAGVVAADPVGALVGERFVTMAFNRSRAPELTPAAAAEAGEMLLIAAQKADPENAHTAKLLAEAAGAAGDLPAQREALRTLVRLDPGDLVAQVRYIDYMAGAAQTIDERSRVYQGALDAAALDAQIRSEMAQRLANIARERGDVGRAAAFVEQALALNSVNIGALQAKVAAAGNGTEELKGLIALVKANPLQPEAWVEMARVMERAGLFDAGAQFMNTALEQYQLAGEAASADLYLELALDLATAGRPVESRPVFEAVGRLKDAPLSALVAAKLEEGEAGQKNAAATTSAPATQAGAGLDERIGEKLEGMVKGDGASARALADAVWVELSAMPTVGGETAGWMEALRKMAPADDAVVMRLEGWRLLREGKLEEARAILEKAAPGDPLAQLGLVKVLVAQNRTADAQREVQDLWWTHPTGLFALQVGRTARGAGLKLAPAVSTQELSSQLTTLPSVVINAHKQGHDLTLVTASLEKRNVHLEEAVPLRVRIANTAGWPMAVGPEGFFKTTIGLSAKTIGVDRTNIGLYGIEELQRVYRLDPRGTIEATVRVDQGAVAEYLAGNPRQTFTLDVAMVTAPRGLKNGLTGLGGQSVPVGDFIRTGQPLGSGNDILQLLEEMPKATGLAQAVDVELMGMAVNLLSDETTKKASRVDEAQEATEARTSLRARVTKALVPMVGSPSAVMRAWTVLNLPTVGLNELQDKVVGMGGDGDSLVRMAWVRAMGEMMKGGGDTGAAAEAAVRKQAGVDGDPQVRRSIEAMLQDMTQVVAASKRAATP